MPADGSTIVVLAAVIARDGRLLVTRRLEGTHLSGYWEFPGGKCEPGEVHESCLEREILEELDVIAEVGPEILVTEHAYPSRTVRLHFRWCRIQGEPTAVLGQDMRWITREELRELQFPEADRELINLLLKSTSPAKDRQ
jgi:mutator protein MutT